MSTGVQQLPKSMVIVLGMLGIELYGFSFTILLTIVFGLLCALDTLFGYYIARRENAVSSKMWQDGVVSKLTQFIILAIIILMSGHLAYSSPNEYIDIACSLLSIIAALAMCTGQIISILENLALITHGFEQGLIKFAIKVLLKIFGIGMDRIEQKLERYSLPLNKKGQKD